MYITQYKCYINPERCYIILTFMRLCFNFHEEKSFSESDFYDAEHLNEIGAEKFTQMINRLIIEKAESTRKEDKLSMK